MNIMDHVELENKIREFIVELYDKEYVGELKVTELNPGYKVEFGLDCPERPLSISCDFTEDKFLDYIYKELKDRRLASVEYYTGYQVHNN